MATGERDPIINPPPGDKGTPSRADKLNGENRTRKIDGGGPNFSGYKSGKLSGSPSPNNPYKGR